MAKNDKSIAFKASRDTSDSDSSENEDEYKMISRKIRNLIMKKKRGFKKQDSSKKDKMICYECNNSGHIQFECPKLKKSFMKDKKHKKEIKQALKATWDDSSDSSDDETDGEVANLCFMALEEPSSDEVTLEFESNDEILLACKKLVHKCDKYLFRINALKEIVKTLEEELEKSRSSNEELTNSLNKSNSKKIEITNENAKLIEQNIFLENENGNLKESISRFIKGKEILDGMIPITSTPLKSKNGIGFENAHASASKIVSLSTPITKVY